MRSPLLWHRVSAGVLALAGTLAPAAAHPIIVLESYVGQRPASADSITAPVLDAGTTAAEITQPAESGYEAYTRGRFAEAEAALRRAFERIHRNPALLVPIGRSGGFIGWGGAL